MRHGSRCIGRKVGVWQGQACHLQSLQQIRSHEVETATTTMARANATDRQAKRRWPIGVLQLWWQPLRSILHIQQKVTSQVESAKARPMRKARTRTRACCPSKAILGVRRNGMKMSSGKLQIPSGMTLSGDRIQKFGRIRQTAHSLRCLERSTSILCLRTRRNRTRVRSGSSSITTREQLR